MSPERRAAVLRQPLRRYTDSTVVSQSQLEDELGCISERGYAIAAEEHEEGYSAIAAPLHDHEGRIVGAVSIFGPSFRLPPATLTAFADELIATATCVSAEMGYTLKPTVSAARRENGR
jgi:DNA-binding IclR family transcriptional regulator